jgi:hypothetical protein
MIRPTRHVGTETRCGSKPRNKEVMFRPDAPSFGRRQMSSTSGWFGSSVPCAIKSLHSYLLLTRPQTRWKESPNVRKNPNSSTSYIESRGTFFEQEWRPVTVTPFQEALLFALGADDGISPEELTELRTSVASDDPDGELQELLDRRLVGRSGDRLVFLTRECATVITPWGETLAGDNGDGRLFAWVMQEAARRNSTASWFIVRA